jgi:hypothetical protein
MDIALSAFAFFTHDVPELLHLTYRTVVVKTPTRIRERDWLPLVPVVTGLAYLAAVALIFITRCRGRRRPHPPCHSFVDHDSTYWLARLLIVRGMGLIYLAAFITSAAQSRALLGSIGLSPKIGFLQPQPQPAFRMLGYAPGEGVDDHPDGDRARLLGGPSRMPLGHVPLDRQPR